MERLQTGWGRTVEALALGVLGGLLAVPSVALGQERPRALFSAEDVPRMRAALDGSLAPIQTALRQAVNAAHEGSSFSRTPDPNWEHFRDPRGISDSLLTFAFAAHMWGDEGEEGARAVAVARTYLNGICGYGDWVFASRQDGPAPDLYSAHFLMNVALAYDWLYGRLSEGERDACRAAMRREAPKMYDAAVGGAWWVEDRIQNHHWINHASLGMAGLVFDGELDAPTGEWMRAADAALAHAHAAMALVEGGAWHEGPGYANYGLMSLVMYGHAQRRRGNADVADAALLRDMPKMRAYAMPPALAHRREAPFWGNFSLLADDSVLALVAHRMRHDRDGLAAWYAQRFLEGQTAGRGGVTSWPPALRGPVMAVILWDETVATEPPRAGELDYHARDLSLFITRSGWDEDDAVVFLKSGPFGGHGNFARVRDGGGEEGAINYGHDHADDLGVQMFGDGEWLTVPVPGYWIGRENGQPEANRTRYANSILIDDRGQLGEGPRRGSSANPDSADWFWERMGTIPARGSTAHQAFALAEGAALYPPSLEVERAERTLLYVDREVVLVRDAVRSASSRRFEVVWHAIDDAVHDGEWLRLEAKNGRALGVRVLAPSELAVRTERQTAANLWRFDPDESMTAVMVAPATDAREQVFLHALTPVRAAAWASRRAIQPLDEAHPERGAIIAGEAGAETRVAFEDGGGLEVEGVAAVVRREGGAVTRFALMAGARLALDAVPWIEVEEGAPATVEVERMDGTVSITGDAVGLRVRAPGAVEVRVGGRSVAFERDGDYVRVGFGTAPEPGNDGGGRPDAALDADAGVGGGEHLGGGCAVGQGRRGGAGALALLALLVIAARRRRSRRTARGWASPGLALLCVLAVGCGEVGPEADGAVTPLDAAMPGPMRDAATGETRLDGGEQDAAGMAPRDGGTEEVVDCFGTRGLNPTIASGREFCLPEDATRETDEWRPDENPSLEATSEPGVFFTDGSPRHSVGSGEGDAWWRNIEMTVYVRWLGGDTGEEFTLYARGERHGSGTRDASRINEGFEAPPGTVTWPGYPFEGEVLRPCLGSAYKASVGIDGRAFFKKEISHTNGYTGRAGQVTVFDDGLPRGEWVGIKMVLRNMEGDSAVRMEIWIDAEADGHWVLATSHEDRGGWSADPDEDGCDAPPFEYEDDQILTWAGPIATLRADDQRFEMRALTIREIAPLP